MAEKVNLDKQEIQSITQIQQLTQKLVIEYGNIELAKKVLETRKDKADTLAKSLREKEEQLVQQLQNKYGQGSINLDEGTFLPAENE
jgi:uncharacterized protein (DUF3084 family)